jgi:hypothetical protein
MAASVAPAIMAHVKAEGRVLLTMDKGIGNINQYPPDQYAGIVLFRPRSTGRGGDAALCSPPLAEPARVFSEQAPLGRLGRGDSRSMIAAID